MQFRTKPWPFGDTGEEGAERLGVRRRVLLQGLGSAPPAPGFRP